ncbi:MAG: helix-turn-helix transcriptional regulator [Paludibacteraceae bacterium]|nr:helix-turn-helix transcriptional regulator [Paludibacteraceae bacterium]
MHPGTKIKELRKAHDMTQSELGELLGVKKSAIQKYEAGEIVNLKLSIVKKLCEIFKVTSDYLIFPEAEECDEKYNAKQLQLEIKVIEDIQALYGDQAVEILHNFTKLNDNGKNHALETIENLTLLEKYSK